MILVTIHMLRWRYPDEFKPNTILTNTIKKDRNFIAKSIEDYSLSTSAQLCLELVTHMVTFEFHG
jgi:hypothetical protein